MNFALRVTLVSVTLFVSTPVYAQEEDDFQSQPTARLKNVFSGDWLTVGAGIGYKPSYDGSDDYDVIPAPIVQGSVSGFDFGARGPGLYVDVVRDSNSESKIKFLLGPQVRVRLDRNNGIKDPVVKLLGERDVGVELGVTTGVSLTKVINPFDRLTFSVDTGWDVAGAHKGNVTSPSVSYSSPLSRAAFASISLNAEHISDNYANTYFSIDGAGAAASGLPVFNATGGWKSVGGSLLTGYDLSGKALDGGFALFGLASYSRLTGDAKRSPVTSFRGDSGQWFISAGVSYTF
jgi:MipA family protein